MYNSYYARIIETFLVRMYKSQDTKVYCITVKTVHSLRSRKTMDIFAKIIVNLKYCGVSKLGNKLNDKIAHGI